MVRYVFLVSLKEVKKYELSQLDRLEENGGEENGDVITFDD